MLLAPFLMLLSRFAANNAQSVKASCWQRRWPLSVSTRPSPNCGPRAMMHSCWARSCLAISLWAAALPTGSFSVPSVPLLPSLPDNWSDKTSMRRLDQGKLRHEPPFKTFVKPDRWSKRRAIPLRVPDAQHTMIHWFGSSLFAPCSRSFKGILRLPSAWPEANSSGDRTSITCAPPLRRSGIRRRAFSVPMSRLNTKTTQSAINA